MRRSSYRFSSRLGCCLVVLLLVALNGFVLWHLSHTFDLGAKPPAEAFKIVLGIPPPAGVTDLRVAGTAHLSGDAWMRFQVADAGAFLVAVNRSPHGPLKGPDPEIKGQIQDYPGSFVKERRSVGWDGLSRLKRPEYYWFKTDNGNSGWAGVIILDRERKLGFVQAILY